MRWGQAIRRVAKRVRGMDPIKLVPETDLEAARADLRTALQEVSLLQLSNRAVCGQLDWIRLLLLGVVCGQGGKIDTPIEAVENHTSADFFTELTVNINPATHTFQLRAPCHPRPT